MRSRLMTAGIVLLALVGCGDRGAELPLLEQAQTAQEARKLIEKSITHHGIVTYRSGDGQGGVGDADFDLTILPKGKVRILRQHLSGGQLFQGSYTLDDQGRLTIDAPDMPDPLPVILIQRDDRSVKLIPADPGRFDRKFWPLRPVSSQEEDRLHERMGNHLVEGES